MTFFAGAAALSSEPLAGLEGVVVQQQTVPGTAEQPLVGTTPISSEPQGMDALETLEGDEVLTRHDKLLRLTVPVTIGGRGQFRFLVDTGAQSTVIARGLADRLGIKRESSATLVAMGSSRQVDIARLDDVEFAGRVVKDLEAPILEESHLGADGILGLDTLQDLRVKLDFRTPAITVADADDPGGDTGFEIVVRGRRKMGRMIISDARVRNVRTTIIVDTGASGTIANRALQRKLGRSGGTELIEGLDVNGIPFSATLGHLPDIKVGPMTWSNMTVAFADSPAFTALGLEDKPAIFVGIATLQQFDEVAIDFARDRILFGLNASKTVRPLLRHGYD